MNRVVVRGKFRRHFLLDLLHRRIGVAAPFRFEKMRSRGRAIRPIRSIATIVFSKVGFSGLAAIFSISFNSSAIPCSIAGREMLVLDLVERRKVIRQRAFGQQRICSH